MLRIAHDPIAEYYANRKPLLPRRRNREVHLQRARAPSSLLSRRCPAQEIMVLENDACPRLEILIPEVQHDCLVVLNKRPLIAVSWIRRCPVQAALIVRPIGDVVTGLGEKIHHAITSCWSKGFEIRHQSLIRRSR